MACARIFAANGARLILNARRRDRLEALAGKLSKQFHNSILIRPLDVRNRAEVKVGIEQLPTDWEAVDALVNNAGLARGFDKLHEGHVEDWE